MIATITCLQIVYWIVAVLVVVGLYKWYGWQTNREDQRAKVNRDNETAWEKRLADEVERAEKERRLVVPLPVRIPTPAPSNPPIPTHTANWRATAHPWNSSSHVVPPIVVPVQIHTTMHHAASDMGPHAGIQPPTENIVHLPAVVSKTHRKIAKSHAKARNKKGKS